MQKWRQIPVFLALVAVFPGSGAGTVFTWVDDNGVTWFSDTPPGDESVSTRLIEELPPPVAGEPGGDNFYSVINQARRMESQRLLAEKLKAERLQAEAEARQARAEMLAAQQPVILYQNAAYPYVYPYYYPHRRHHPHDKRPRRDDRPGRFPGPEQHRGTINRRPALRAAAVPKSHRVLRE